MPTGRTAHPVARAWLHRPGAFLLACGWTLLAGLAAPLSASADFAPQGGIAVEATLPVFDRINNQYSVYANLRNAGPTVLTGPTRLVVEQSSLPVQNAQGTTPAGEPYFTISSAPDFRLAPGARSARMRIGFALARTKLTHRFRVETALPNSPPVAHAGPDQTPRVGEIVTLDASASVDPDGQPLSYIWSIDTAPAGSTADLSDPNAIRPTIRIDRPGRYLFTLIVDDTIATSAPDQVIVDTRNSAPTAHAGPDQSAPVNAVVTLDASASNDIDGDPLRYAWTTAALPTGSAAALSDPGAAQPWFRLDRPGDYWFDLTVNDGTADSDPDQVRISTQNSAPTADAGADRTAPVNTDITLDGSASSDPDRDPLGYLWSLTAAPTGSAAALDDPTIVNPGFRIDLPGTYVGSLVVNDGEYASAPDTVTISTVNSRPSADAGPDRAATTGAALQLDGSGSSDPDGDPLSFAWSLLHQPIGSGAGLTDALTANPWLTPDLPGDYIAQLIVSDGALASEPDTATITAADPPPPPNRDPAITSSPVTAAQVGVAYSYQASAEEPDGDPLTWHLGTAPGGMVIDPASGLVNWTPDAADLAASPVTVRLTVTDGRGGSAAQDYAITVSPAAGPQQTVVPNLVGLGRTAALAAVGAAGLTLGESSYTHDDAPDGQVLAQQPAPAAVVDRGSAVDLTVSLGPDAGLPPNPATVAPPLDQTEVTPLHQTTRFLYDGPNPVQTGMDPDTIEPERVAIVRGRVLDRASQPLPGVTVAIKDHPEFGQTATRADGAYDLAVNGGGLLTLDFQRSGYLPAQRKIDTPWRDFATLDELILVPVDPQVTVVDLTDGTQPFQVAVGSVVTDADGSRQATVLVPRGTSASMTLPDGSSVPLTTLSLRATEYTVGTNGPKAMPGELPPNSGYTYAVELSADEALAAGAHRVDFSQPVSFYVDNFLAFPVGEVVPVGWYDYEKAAWIPSRNGRVIKLLSIDGDQRAVLDVAGANQPADAAALAALGITDDERATLAQRYAPGASLWRVQIEHLTPWDCNWPWGLPSVGDLLDWLKDALGASDKTPPDPKNSNCRYGCVINPQRQSLGEAIDLVGLPFDLHYASDRVPGQTDAYSIDIPITGAAETLANDLQGVDVTVEVAGRRIEQHFPADPDQTFSWTWDGKDAYGRPVSGIQDATVTLSYRYPLVYYGAGAGFQASFAQFADPGMRPIGRRGNSNGAFERKLTRRLGVQQQEGVGLAGWSLGIHHSYGPEEILLYGNGDQHAAKAQAFNTAQQMIYNLSPSGDIAISQEGVLYFVYGHSIWKYDANGLGAFAGNLSTSGFTGDNGPALNARFNNPVGLDFGPDGSLYIADSSNNCIRRIAPNGIVSTVAGTGAYAYTGDGGLATSAALKAPIDVAAGQDGSLYIADRYNFAIRKVTPDGRITTIAGKGSGWYPTGGPAINSSLFYPEGVAVDPAGNVYLTHSNCEVFKISTDGILSRFAGNTNYYCFAGGNGFAGDGGPAVSARLNQPEGITVGPDGNVYIGDAGNRRIRRVDRNGIITTVAGSGSSSAYQGDGLPAVQANLQGPDYPAFGPDGRLYVMDDGANRVLRIGSSLPRLSGNQLAGLNNVLVANATGTEGYYFDAAGRHLATLDTVTGATLYSFGYSSLGALETITDLDGRITRIERGGDGAPTAIVSPDGQRTTLAMDANGWLASVSDPEGRTYQMGYTAAGLLINFEKPNGSRYAYTYDARGRFETDTDPAGGGWTLERTDQARGYTAGMTSGEGRVSRFAVEPLTTGDRRQTNTAPDGTVTTTLFGTNGSETTNLPTSLTLLRKQGPDPRFGMVAPVATEQKTTTPAGLIRTLTSSRTAKLATASDPFSLTTLTETTAVNGRATTATYTGANRTWSIRTPLGRTATSTLDAKGRIAASQVSGLASTALVYNSDGRLTSITAGAEVNAGADARLTSLAYHASGPQQGFLASITDPAGRQVSFTYDAAARLREQTLPGNRLVTYDYDANGNLLSLTPPGRPAHRFTYTDVDLVETYNPPAVPGGGSTSYQYNRDKQLTLVERPDGKTLDYDYSPESGKLAAVTIARGTYDYGYSPATGQLASIQDPAGGSLTYGYDGALPTSVTWTGEVAGSLGLAYDNDLRVREVTVNGADPIAYAYDNDGRLIQAGAETLTYHADSGLLAGISLGDHRASYGYNAFGELASIVERHGEQTLYEVHYTRDRLGRIETKTETVEGTTTVYRYGYDAAGRLAQVEENGVVTATYTYDANGNRLTAPGLTGTPVYDDQDRLLVSGNTSFTYTANGELRTKTENGQTTTYDYDELGNLIRVDLPDGTVIEYVIDGQDRRVGKKVNGVLVQGFLYQDQLNPVAELDHDGNIVSRFVYASRSNLPDYIVKDGKAYRIISDHLGSPRVVVNEGTGQAAQHLNYDVFGNQIADSHPGFQPFGFSGGLFDRDQFFIRFGARDYSGNVARWTSVDPMLHFSGDLNVYQYVGNDPINSVDLSGLAQECWRPLDPGGMQLPAVGSAYHAQFVYENGENSGFFEKGGVRAETGDKASSLQCRPRHLDDDTLRQAEKDVQATGDWISEKYNLASHNCQHYRDAVIDEYNRRIRRDLISQSGRHVSRVQSLGGNSLEIVW